MNGKALVALAVGLWLLGLPGPTALAQGTKSLIRDMARTRGDDLSRRAGELVQARKFEDALAQSARAQALYQRAGDREREAGALMLLGRCYQERNSPREALEHYRRAATLLGSSGNRFGQAVALTSVGKIGLFHLGRTAEGADALNQAGALFQAEGQNLLAAAAYHFIALKYGFDTDYPRVREYTLKALARYEAAGQWLFVADLHEALAFNSNFQGQFREELAHYQQALSLYEKLQLPVGQARMESKLGEFYRRRNDYPLALHHLGRAVTAWSTAERQPTQSALAALLEQGRLPSDMAELQALVGKDFQEWKEDPRGGQVQALTLMGDLHRAMKEPEAALKHYGQALPLAQALGDRLGERNLHEHIGTLYRGEKKFPQAVESYERALALAREAGDVLAEGTLLGQLSLAAAWQGNAEKAREALGRIESLLGAVPPMQRAPLLSFLGLGYGELKDFDKSLSWSRQALELKERLGERDRVVEELATQARFLAKKGEPEKALELYERAMALHETIRATAGVEELKMGLATQAANLYVAALLLLLERGEKVRAFELGERGRARTFLDTLGNARPRLDQKGEELVSEQRVLARALSEVNEEIRRVRSRAGQVDQAALDALGQRRDALQAEANALRVRLKAAHPRYDSLQSVEPLGLQEVRKLLDGRTTLVSYLVLPKKVMAFVITQRSFDAVELPLTRDEVRGIVENATAAFREPKVDASSTLEELHGLFVAPLAPYLKTERVGIVPHDELHYLPFAAFKDGQRHFGDTHTLFYLPSVSALRYLPKKPTNQGEVLALAQGQAEGLAPLPFADTEAESIARLYGARALTGAMATEQALKERAGKASILHVAAHGEFKKNNPRFSRIALAPGGGEDGSLMVEEIYNLDLSATQLVVLSACDTQVGAQNRGDDMVGLARAFLYAQAPTVVASLWAVNDQATGLLMTAFYTQLKQGKTKAEALREAQAQVRARFPHPFYWAAFVLTGEPG